VDKTIFSLSDAKEHACWIVCGESHLVCKKPPNCPPKWLHSPSSDRNSLWLDVPPALGAASVLGLAVLTGVWWNLMTPHLHFLTMDLKHLFILHTLMFSGEISVLLFICF
jgi:hypothetical protein